MTKILLLGVCWLALTTFPNRASCFSFDGSTMYFASVARFYSFGARQKIHRRTNIASRMMVTVKSSSATTANKEADFLDDSRTSDEILSSLPDNLKTWFDIQVPEGRCIGVETTNEQECFPQNLSNGISVINNDHWIHSAFHKEELEFGAKLKKTRNSFLLGRLALRIGLDFPDYPILRDNYGRPELKADVLGSISHKSNKGVAIVSRLPKDDCDSDFVLSGLGIDLEMRSRPGKPNIAKRILTANERKSLGNISGITVEEEVLLRFSLKEAIYKAANPLLNQYVGFQEAEVTPHADGTASCKWLLDTKADRSISKLTAHWRKLDENYFLTSASAYEAK